MLAQQLPVALLLTLATLFSFLSISSSLANELEFQLPSSTGEIVTCDSTKVNKGVVVCFIGNECPLAKLYVSRLSLMATELRARGIEFYGINSNQQDSMDELKSFKDELNVTFQLLKDYENQVADRFAAKRTPEVFLLDKNMKMVYRGAIDNQYSPGIARDAATKHYLKDAVLQLLADETIALNSTPAEGCLIGRVKTPIENPTVTYCNQVARLFQTNCVECHRSNQIGPFALEEYDEAKGWAEMVVEVVENGRMPPWHATDEHLEFTNARKLSETDKQILRDWLEQGTPYGDASQLPEPKSYSQGWLLHKEPDLVIDMAKRPFTVPANGTVEYQYFVVDPGFEEDRWVTAAAVQPGNFSIVHHCIVFVRPPDGGDFDGIGWLTGYVPGMRSAIFKPTHGRRIPAGSKLVFQMHYTPNGTQANDLTRLGLVFGKPDEITHQVYTITALNQEFEIPAEKKGHVVETNIPFIPEKSELIAFTPHMHFRGKSFESEAVIEGDKKKLIHVPNYDFNWQHDYQLKNPLSLDRVEAIHCRFTFDNSEENPFNPDSTKRIYWGDQTWEEMAVAFFHVAQPKNLRMIRQRNKNAATQNSASLAEMERKAQQFVDDYFKKFDADKDGKLIRDETPHAIQHFRFYTYDANRDGILSKDELLEIARERFK